MTSYLLRAFQGLVSHDAPAVVSQEARKPYAHGITGAILQQIFDLYCGPLERCRLMGTSSEFCSLVKRTRAYQGLDRIARLTTGKFSETFISNPKSRWSFDGPPAFSAYSYDPDEGAVITGNCNGFNQICTLWDLNEKRQDKLSFQSLESIQFVRLDMGRNRALIAGFVKLIIWDLKSGRSLRSHVLEENSFSYVFANFQTNTVFYGTDMGVLFHLATGRSYFSDEDRHPITWIEDDPARNRCFDSTVHHTIRIWKRREGTIVSRFIGYKCTYDHTRGVLIAGHTKTITFIDALSGKTCKIFADIDKTSELAGYHYCKTTQKLFGLFSHCGGKNFSTKVLVWDIKTEALISSFSTIDTSAHTLCSPRIDFDPEHNLLLMDRIKENESHSLQFWDIKTQKLVHTIIKKGVVASFTWDQRRRRLIIFNQRLNRTNSISIIDYSQPRTEYPINNLL